MDKNSQETEAVSQVEARAKVAWDLLVSRWAMVALMVIMAAVFSAILPSLFPTYENLKVILTTQSVMTILAIAMVLPLVVGHFDLSVAANLGLSCITCVTFLTKYGGQSIYVSCLIAVALSTFVGLINGLLVTRIKINALISTLGMSSILSALVMAWTNGKTLSSNIPESLLKIAGTEIAGMPLPVFYMIIIAVVVWFFLDHTSIGRYLYAIGGSRDAARLAGINVQKLTLLVFVLAGFLAGIAGLVTASRLGVGNPTTGPSMLLPAFAASMLGAAAIRPGTYNIAGTIVAVFTLAVGVTGLQLLGAAFWIEGLFNGVALILAVGLTRYLQREEL